MFSRRTSKHKEQPQADLPGRSASKLPPVPESLLSEEEFLTRSQEYERDSQGKITPKPHAQDLLDISAALGQYHDTVRHQGSLWAGERDEKAILTRLRDRWKALDNVEKTVFAWARSHPIPARRLGFFPHLSLMEKLLGTINRFRAEIADGMERLGISPYTELSERDLLSKQYNQAWKGQLEGKFLKGNWRKEDGQNMRSLLNATVLRLLWHSDRSACLASGCYKALANTDRPVLYLHDYGKGHPNVASPAEYVKTEGGIYDSARLRSASFGADILESRTYVTVDYERGRSPQKRQDLLGFYPPSIHLAYLLDMAQQRTMLRQGFGFGKGTQFATSLGVAHPITGRFFVSSPDEYVWLESEEDAVVGNLDTFKALEGGPSSVGETEIAESARSKTVAHDTHWRKRFVNRVAKPPEIPPVIKNEKLDSLLQKVQSYDTVTSGTQASVFKLNPGLWSGTTLYLKILREGSFSSVAAKEHFAADFLLMLDSPRVRSQVSELVRRNSPEFLTLLAFADEQQNKTLARSLRTFLATDMEHLIVFRPAIGMSLSQVSPEETLVIGVLTDPDFFRAIGELAFYDLLMGNADRVFYGVHKTNLFVEQDFGQLSISPIDHALDFSWMYSFVRDLDPQSKQYPTLSSLDLRSMVNEPWKHSAKLKEVFAQTKEGLSRILESEIMGWQSPNGPLGKITETFEERHNSSDYTFSPRVKTEQLRWFKEGFMVGAVHLYEKRHVIDSLRARTDPSFQVDADLFFHQCEKAIELVGIRYQELKKILPES
ncbi:hypothetical protein FUAX_42700 (plasmid) [Fulvitalea axinellae]|uniref:Uncharacterized protein n=1 Tax=Fulvitalea axinellae TaxID=1182444 RepID=A0AAU9CUW9_9BACT|nr:hypothetical protein FUAX_42700 [Fulvitalea axinellae]